MSSGNRTEPDISIQWCPRETEETLTSLRLSFLIHGMRTTTLNSVLLHRAGVRNYEDVDMKLPLPFLCSCCWNCSWMEVSLGHVRPPSLVHTPRASLASLHQLLGNPQESGLCSDGSNFFNHALHSSLSTRQEVRSLVPQQCFLEQKKDSSPWQPGTHNSVTELLWGMVKWLGG